MNKNIGIIGGNGFIGKNLTEYFTENNYNVTVVGRTIDKNKFQSANVTAVEADVKSTEILINNLKNCETLIWLVNTSVPSTKNDSLLVDFDMNINPLIRFLESINELSLLKRFIFLSSGGTIYGNTVIEKPLGENSSKNPISSYGLSKIVSENYIKFLTLNSPIQSFILRPSNVYGTHQNLTKPQGIIGYAFKSIINNTSIDLYDDGKVTRDFIYVTDLAKAIHACMNSDYKKSTTSVYNIGSQIGYTIKEILEKITNIAQKDIQIIPKSSRGFDCNYNVLKHEKIKTDLNWAPEIDIDEGLKLVWDWIKMKEYAK